MSRKSSRGGSGALLVAAVVIGSFAGCETTRPYLDSAIEHVTSRTWTVEDLPTPGTGTDTPPVATVQPDPAAVTDAAAALAGLDVLDSRPDVPGYERGCSPDQACSFGSRWTDDQDAPGGHDGCGTRIICMALVPSGSCAG